MNYQEALRQLREPPCSIEYCDSIRFPFGRFKGERVKDIVEREPEWANHFAWICLQRPVDPESEWHEANMALAFSLLFLIGEREATRKGEEIYGPR